MLSVTNIGLSAMTRADQGGFLINLGSFKVTERDVSAMTDLDFIDATDVLGTVVYEGGITAIETVDTSSVRLTLTIPLTIPLDGSVVNIRELGVYLDTGELFAYGKLEPSYEKTNDYSIKIYVVVTANRLADIINVVVSQNNSLPSIPYVRQLIDSRESEQNVVVVLDEDTSSYGSATASLAIKSGPGGLHWSYAGHDRVYLGNPDSVSSRSAFKVAPERGGFWFNDYEVVICQITSGTGAGQSRKMFYRKSDSSFTCVDKDFREIQPTSVVAIWRSLKHTLPSRYATIPEYFVLGIGTNTWQQTTNSVANKTRYNAVFISGTTDSTNKLVHNDFTKLTNETAFVFVGDKCLTPQDYAIAGDTLSVFDASAKNVHVEIQGFYAITADIGGLLSRFETTFLSDGSTARFYMPIVPDTGAWVIAYIDGKYVAKTQYTFEDTSIVFNDLVAAGKRLHIVMFGTYDDDAAYSELQRTQLVMVEPQREIAYGSDLYDQNGTIVYLNGNPIRNDQYEITPEKLRLLGYLGDFYVNGQAVVDISVFKAISATKSTTQTGINSGPEWIDPAGTLGYPNRLVPKSRTFISDGARTVYGVHKVPTSNHILIFAGSVFQDPRNYDYTDGFITLSTPIPYGIPIDIICFTESLEDGTAVECAVQNFALTNSLTYNIEHILDADHMLLFIGGTYQHKTTYYVDTVNNQLSLQTTDFGQTVEIWYFKTIPHAGWHTDVWIDFNTANKDNTYPLTEAVERRENTLQFLGYVYQYKAKYAVGNDLYDRPITEYLQPVDSVLVSKEVPNITISFVSGIPKTRLLKREDANKLYMPRFGPYVGWDNLTPKLKSMLACPITKLLGLVTGAAKQDFNSGDSSADKLADKWGLQPVTKTLSMDVIPTANYAATGSGAAIGVPVRFNIFKYLELYLRQDLGDSTFSIRKVEQGKKYLIDDIKLGDLKTEVLARSDIPNVTADVGIFVNYPNKYMSTTYPTMPMLTSFLDMNYSMNNVTLPAGFDYNSTKLRTVSVTKTEDNIEETRTYTHKIQDDYAGKEYTVVWKRLMIVKNHNADYMTCIDAGGAPGYVRYFARLYANWQYNDYDIRFSMYFNKQGCGVGSPSDAAWDSWGISVRSGAYGQYPASAGYTAGLTFGVTVDNIDMETGDADLTISMLSGTIGYSYFPANMLIKTITIPTTYTVYPAIKVNDDGSVEPMFSSNDLFTSCCWTGLAADSSGNPLIDLGCGAGSGITIPTVENVYTYTTSPKLSGKYPASMVNLTVTIDGKTFEATAVDSPITCSEGAWQMSLAKAGIILAAGSYDVAVVSIDKDGNKVSDNTTGEVVIRKYDTATDTTAPTAPTVDTKTVTTAQPSITGTYPILDADGGFEVTIDGSTYVLGVSPALTSTGGTNAAGDTVGYWTLNLATAGKSLTNGTYNVGAVVKDGAGNQATDSTTNELTVNLYNPTATGSAGSINEGSSFYFTLSGGKPNSGVTFTGATSGSITLDGNGSYTSSTFTSLPVGSHSWTFTFDVGGVRTVSVTVNAVAAPPPPAPTCTDTYYDDIHASYVDSIIKYTDGSVSAKATIVSGNPKNQLAREINAKYISMIGRPAEQVGMHDYIHQYDLHCAARGWPTQSYDVLNVDALAETMLDVQNGYDIGTEKPHGPATGYWPYCQAKSLGYV